MPSTHVPPRPQPRPTLHSAHGDQRSDEYAWLRDREDPAVIAHLEAENAYTDAALAHLGPLRERIFNEIRSRIQETDLSAPVPFGPFLYYSRTEEGRQYPLLCRSPRDAPTSAPLEQVILDQNALADGHDYTHVGDAEVSPDHTLLAYTVDHDGGERHTLHVRDLASGVDLADAVTDVYYSMAWANDNRTVLYTRVDAAMRPHQVWAHVVGQDAATDVLLHAEADERFFAGVGRSRSGGLILIHLGSHTTSETLLVDPEQPLAPPRLVTARRDGIEYTVDHHVDGAGAETLLIVTNDGAANFRLVQATVDDPGHHHWRAVMLHDDTVRLVGIDSFSSHIALHERADGLSRVRVLSLPFARHEPVLLEQPEAVGTVGPGDNREWATSTLRLRYESLVTPPQVVDVDVVTRHRTVIKETPVLGGYDRSLYRTEQLWAEAEDGTHVPMSVVYRVGVPADGTAPALLTGYGSYEISSDPTFRHSRLSLLDRGVVCAIAHVRGGGEMGRTWYERGKLAHKSNTFTDFAACGDRLVAEELTAHDRLAIRGGSAGGLLMGAVVNLRPDLARAVVAQVPFVDVVSTMLDETLPLTVIEWEEWGNPNEAAAYARMLAYSPYDNVAEVAHPAILATGGLNDPRVGFWEPAKWVARLRDRDRGGGPFLLRMEMGAGHGGPSGRYDAWREEAYVLAFILDRLPGWTDPG